MDFRTKIKVNNALPTICRSQQITLIGSCFSDNIGLRFKRLKFNCLSNPFGTTYNPISIFDQIKRTVRSQRWTKQELIENEGLWKCFDLHSSFNHSEAQILLENANTFLELGHSVLKKDGVLFITLGTSWVYKFKSNKTIVNNCHKFPPSNFEKELLSPEEIVNSYREVHAELKPFNSNLSVVFTLSPVRHLKDGFSENSLSKSVLRIAIDRIQKEFGAFYFPSYEIVMDDLRDYRFFEKDMLHPNEVATYYIWKILEEHTMDKNTIEFSGKIESLQKLLDHKIFNPDTKASQAFLKKTIQLANELTNLGIDFRKELEKLKLT